MVSAELYIRAFFSSIQKRFQLIRRLKTEKAEIDKKVLSNAQLLPEDVKRLVSIIGRDHILRSAESVKKPTLRHLTWKAQKSIEIFKSFDDTLYIKNVQPLYANKRLRAKALKVKQFIYFFISRLYKSGIDDVMVRLDFVYIGQVEALNRNDVEGYRKFLEQEKEITMETHNLFVDVINFRENLMSIINDYCSLLKTEDFSYSVAIASLFLAVVAYAAFLSGFTANLLGLSKHGVWVLPPRIELLGEQYCRLVIQGTVFADEKIEKLDRLITKLTEN